MKTTILASFFILFFQISFSQSVEDNWIKKPFNQAPQFLLTNDVEFNGHSSFYGASGFLVKVELEGFNRTYAVTAKHLLTKDLGGVTPEVKPEKLNKDLKKWLMFPRTDENEVVEIDSLVMGSPKVPKNDVLVFSTKTIPSKIVPLKLSDRGLPAFVENEPAYIIGCPCAQKNCSQNIYKGTYFGFDEDLFKVVISNVRPTFDYSGFSGAPIVDKDGKVYAVIYGGKKEKNGSVTIWATPLMPSILPMAMGEIMKDALLKGLEKQKKKN